VTTFEEWLAFVFDRPADKPEWYFDLDAPRIECSDSETVEYIARMCTNAREVLAPFSDDQVGLGLNYIFNNVCSDVVFSLKSDSVSFDRRMSALRAIGILYRDCFNPRCAPALGSRSDPLASRPLNQICYMLWDISPIAYWEDRPQERFAYEVIVDVMGEALQMSNIACVESALHGLGHICCLASDLVEGKIEVLLGQTSFTDERLLEYANRARVGNVL